MRWSQLKQLIEAHFDDALQLEVFCTAQRGDGRSIGRYWFVLNGTTIWDEPKNVSHKLREGVNEQGATVMTDLFRLYLDTGRADIFALQTASDIWGLLDVLKAADKRIGKKRLLELFVQSESTAVKKIILTRVPEAIHYRQTNDHGPGIE